MTAKKSAPAWDGMATTMTVAAAIGLSDRRVRQLADEGLFQPVRKGKLLKFDLVETVRAYVDWLRDQAASKEDADVELAEQKLQAEVDYKRAKAAEEELMLEELRGNMHRSEDVEECIEQLVYTARSEIVALPGRVAMDVAQATSAAEAEKIVRAECNHILNDLSEFRYDPAAFRKLVRERQGWREREDDADEGGP